MHPDTERFMDFIRSATKVTASATISERAGISKSTFHMQRNNARRLPAESVIAICVAWDVDLLAGLEAAGIIGADDASRAASLGQLRSLPDTLLLEELLARAEERDRLPVDELAAKRAEREAARGPGSSIADDLDTDFHDEDEDEDEVVEPRAASERGRHSMDNIDPGETD